MQKCQEQNFLTRADKKAITHLVVDDFKDRFGKLTPAELQDRASELGRLFPGEPEVWLSNVEKRFSNMSGSNER